MNEIKPVDIKKDLNSNELELIKPLFVKAKNLIEQHLAGLPVNKDRTQSARLIITQYRGLLQAENNRKQLFLNSKRFDLNLLNQFGDEVQKKQLKAIFKKQFKDIKIIEKL